MTLRIIKRSLIALLLLLVPAIATAQTLSSPAPTSSDQLLKPEQLAALVSPIALYPDSLLSTVLMASTYPLEIVQAERWLTQNKNLSDDALKTAVDKQVWDESVKALIATPPVLAMMSSELDWTQKLGDAVLAQQPDVIDAIQRLRLRAQDNGNDHPGAEGLSRATGQSTDRRHRADERRYGLCTGLRSRRRLRRLAICGISSVLLGIPGLLGISGYRCRRARTWPLVRRRIRSRPMGIRQLCLGRPRQLGQWEPRQELAPGDGL